MGLTHLNRKVMGKNKTIKPLDKVDEIEMLFQLCKGGGYFAEKFEKDFQQMERNIRNDFPIEHQTEFNKAGDELEGMRVELKKANEYCLQKAIRIDNLETEVRECEEDMKILLIAAVESSKTGKPLDPYAFWGMNEIVKVKLRKRIALTEEEINFLASKLEDKE